jgi:AraC family transcriptional regulator
MTESGQHNSVTSIVGLKNMVSGSCIKLVRLLLENSGAHVRTVRLGNVEFEYDPLLHSESFFIEMLAFEGFEPIVSREEQIIEKTKLAVIELIHQAGNVNSLIRNSDYLVERLGLSYSYLSALFPRYEHITLEKFIILHKIEKVKELIEYDEFTLSEISLQLGYSSVQYLSNQFRQVTGISVSDYKKNESSRIPLEMVGRSG